MRTAASCVLIAVSSVSSPATAQSFQVGDRIEYRSVYGTGGYEPGVIVDYRPGDGMYAATF